MNTKQVSRTASTSQILWKISTCPLRWRHNGPDSVSNHQPHDCLLNRLFRRRSKKTSKLRVTGLCAGNSPGTAEFPAQMASNAENVFIWWRHHVCAWYLLLAHTTFIEVAISVSKWIFIVLVWYLKIHEWPTTTELRLQEGGGTYEKLIKAYCIRTIFNGYATGRWWHNLRSTVHGQQKHTPPLRTLGKPSMCVICVEWSKVYALQESLHIFIIWQIVFTMGSIEFILCCGKISWRCVKSLASLPNELHFIYVLQNINAYILC